MDSTVRDRDYAQVQMGDQPTIMVESVRPLDAPQLAGLADTLRDVRFESEHSLPYEQRSLGAVSFIAFRLADAVSTILVEKLVVAVRDWVSESAYCLGYMSVAFRQ
jgi:hypothetical protein